jgi:hypothetical protein
MYKCEICNKEFDKKMALQGHKAHHVKRSGLDIILIKERGKKQKEENTLKYLESPEHCKQCNIVIGYDKFLEKSADKRMKLKEGKTYNYFCSSSCSAKFNNSNRIITEETKKKTSESLLKKYESTKHLRINNIGKTYSKYTNQEYVCSVCSKQFYSTKEKKRKTCSEACKFLSISIQRQKYLEKNGNFSTPREHFTYKNTSIEVDSNLEKAGLIYLIDKLNAVSIERFKNILIYNDGIKNKTYNPDFICYINNQTHIVEIKQKWTSKSNHKYNLHIPHKKKALEEYCNKNNYKCLWIDFDTVPDLKLIYKKILKERNLCK